MNRELISAAARSRLNDVRERVNGLDPQHFGEGGFYLSSVKEILRGEPAALKARLPQFIANTEWAAADTDCLTALRVLSLHGQKALRSEAHPATEQFVRELKTSIAAGESSFELLVNRYSWPLNFSLAAEMEIRELVLMRLMTKTRAAIEKSPAGGWNADELLLVLNLISVHACATNDLRFVDALNYYYELLPAALYPEPESSLVVSWLALYARALASWS